MHRCSVHSHASSPIHVIWNAGAARTQLLNPIYLCGYVHACPQTHTVCVQRHVPVRMANWEWRPRPCSCHVPIDINGTTCMQINRTPVQANTAPIWLYALAHPCEQSLHLLLCGQPYWEPYDVKRQDEAPYTYVSNFKKICTEKIYKLIFSLNAWKMNKILLHPSRNRCIKYYWVTNTAKYVRTAQLCQREPAPSSSYST